MKIGVYDPYLDDVGGGEKYMLTAAECLSSNHEVSIFWDNVDDLEVAKERFGLSLSKIQITKNIFSPKVGFIKKIFETKKYDAIIFLSDGSIPVSLSKNLFMHVQQPIKGAGQGFKTRLKLLRVKKVFCNSYFTKGYIDKQLGTESLVIYPPVDLHPRKVKKENTILHVGRFRVVDETVGGAKDYKKQYIMVDAFKKMCNKIPKWKFVLAVSVKESDEGNFDRLVTSTKNYPIEFLVNKSNDDLWDIYNKAKIYWHASGYGENLKEHPEYAEHFGISTVEAMGAGAVPVVINAGGQIEIIENEKNGFLWNSLEELQEKTKFLVENNSVWQVMSDSAKKRAKDFGSDKFCKELEELLK